MQGEMTWPRNREETEKEVDYQRYLLGWYRDNRTVEMYHAGPDGFSVWFWSKEGGWESIEDIEPDMGWMLLSDQTRERLNGYHDLRYESRYKQKDHQSHASAALRREPDDSR